MSDSSNPLLRRAGSFLLQHTKIERLVRQAVYDPVGAIGNFRRTRPDKDHARRPRYSAPAARPTVDVIVPCHDNETTIAAAIESLLEQTHGLQAIIVVDDASTDGTTGIVRSMMGRNPRIRLEQLLENRGVAFARNTGLSRSTAELVAFQDADDISHPRRIEWQVKALQTPSRVAVTCDGCRTRNGIPVEVDDHYYHELSVSVLFRRETVLERIGYIQNITIAEDVEYLARMRAAFGTAAVGHLQKCLYFAELRQGSAIHRHGEMQELGANRYAYLPTAETRRRLDEIAGAASLPPARFVDFTSPGDTSVE